MYQGMAIIRRAGRTTAMIKHAIVESTGDCIIIFPTREMAKYMFDETLRIKSDLQTKHPIERDFSHMIFYIGKRIIRFTDLSFLTTKGRSLNGQSIYFDHTMSEQPVTWRAD